MHFPEKCWVMAAQRQESQLRGYYSLSTFPTESWSLRFRTLWRVFFRFVSSGGSCQKKKKKLAGWPRLEWRHFPREHALVLPERSGLLTGECSGMLAYALLVEPIRVRVRVRVVSRVRFRAIFRSTGLVRVVTHTRMFKNLEEIVRRQQI